MRCVCMRRNCQLNLKPSKQNVESYSCVGELASLGYSILVHLRLKFAALIFRNRLATLATLRPQLQYKATKPDSGRDSGRGGANDCTLDLGIDHSYRRSSMMCLVTDPRSYAFCGSG